MQLSLKTQITWNLHCNRAEKMEQREKMTGAFKAYSIHVSGSLS